MSKLAIYALPLLLMYGLRGDITMLAILGAELIEWAFQSGAWRSA